MPQLSQIMKRRMKVTFTKIRRTSVLEQPLVIHVICPVCLAATEMPSVADTPDAVQPVAAATRASNQMKRA
jgi:hypothetical protein